MTLFCLLKRKKRYGNNASWQRPHDAENSSRAFQRSQEKTSTLAQRYGLSRTTVTKWRSRITTTDAPMGPAKPRSTVLSPAEEAVIVEFRRRTLLPLDDVMGCLLESIPKLSRSSLHRCLRRHGTHGCQRARLQPVAEASLHRPKLVTCTLTLPSCSWPRANSICFWPLTGFPSSPMWSLGMTWAR